jgi:hypothetical protein
MRRFAVTVLVLLGLLLPVTLRAETCSDRQLTCFDYCARNYNNAPRCLETCKNLLARCLSTSCWESNVSARRCGFDRQ